ncbi:efflux RND transporter permease subunit [Permianibacter sp. IMCC34836]|uniref:efflux RND transporter permease subunit n=1 Tax=Permianibacter fluminis TaxID=2738515 RepID=UPI00155226EB|nr:CusA/CzcA family heavy metal efflux RND transporter [Permianibacter fluminis]NQD38266.1 efflux RND transporter permease subunit [Permianibacter fluminis]
MLSRLVQFALTQRTFILILTALLAGVGWYAFRQLPIDAFPDVASTQVKIILKAPGMTPEEVESRVAIPIETEMLGIPQQEMLRTTVKYGIVDLTLNFVDGTDIYWARQQVAERLSGIMSELPSELEGGMAPITTPLGEMFQFVVDNPNMSLMERKALLDWVIRPALRTVPGVADVNVLGGVTRSYEVIPDPVQMAAAALTIDDLQQAITKNNRNDGAGRLREGGEVLLVRSEGNIRDLDDLRTVVVGNRDGVPLRLGDVAELRIGELTRNGVVTDSGKAEAVEGLVLGLAGANARDVVTGIEAKIRELQPGLPEGTTLRVFYNRAALVDHAVGTVAEALAEAIILVLVLLGVFLGDVRAAVTVAVVLPLSALATFILMRQVGMSANLMSLGGLAIAIGMLVDAAVVVVENIVQHLAHDPSAGKLPRLHVIYRAVREVAAPVTTGMGIIIIVFLPLLTLQGLEGKFFVPVALTIAFALASSLLLSLTVIPVLASFLLKSVKHEDPWLPRTLQRIYEPTLQAAFRQPKAIAIGAGVMLLAATAVYFDVGKTFIPTMDEGDIVVGIEKLPTVSLEETAALDLKIQQAIMNAVPEVTAIVARAGSDEIGLDPMGLNQTDTFLVLKPRSEWRMQSKEQLLDELRKVLDELPGTTYSFTMPIEMRVSEMIIGVRGDLAIKIFGPELPVLNQLAADIETAVKTVPGNQDVYTVVNDGVQYLRVVVDRLAAGRFDLSTEEVQEALRMQIQGTEAGTVIEGNRRTPILIRGPENLRTSPGDFSQLRLTTASGETVPLTSVARLERTAGPVKIDRELGSRYSVVIANVSGRDLVGFVEETKRIIAAQVKLPDGYRISFGGQFENQQRAAARLGIVTPLALVLIFLLLFSSFRSVRQSLLVLSNIPFALVGGIFALWLTGEYLSVPASVGFIALLGIAVLNGVVMVSYFNQLHAEGLSVAEAVRVGAIRRLRPVLMTAAITAFGLIPLLFASGPGSEIQRPLAIVVIGGLITATALTLIILPMLYARFAFTSTHTQEEKHHD